MQVKYLNLKKQFQNEEIKQTINEVFDDCQFILGSKVEEFEKRFAELCQVDFALGVNSGTDALILALKALNIGRGDEVITAPNSFIATAGAIVAVGARPVFVDVGEDLNIDTSLIVKSITSKTKAIIPVHLTGNPCDMDKIMALSELYKIPIIEDAAQAVDATFKGKRVGSFGIGCFSLHPLKNLNVCGDGGVITTNDQQIYERLKLLRNHGLYNRDFSFIFGLCSRLDTLQAAIALKGLDKIKDITEKRIQNAYFYNDNLDYLHEHIKLPRIKKDLRQVFHTYIIQTEDRQELKLFLEGKGIETKIHYPFPIHKQSAYDPYRTDRDYFPVCEHQARTILSLPIHQHLTEEEQEYVVNMIGEFYAK